MKDVGLQRCIMHFNGAYTLSEPLYGCNFTELTAREMNSNSITDYHKNRTFCHVLDIH